MMIKKDNIIKYFLVILFALLFSSVAIVFANITSFSNGEGDNLSFQGNVVISSEFEEYEPEALLTIYPSSFGLSTSIDSGGRAIMSSLSDPGNYDALNKFYVDQIVSTYSGGIPAGKIVPDHYFGYEVGPEGALYNFPNYLFINWAGSPCDNSTKVLVAGGIEASYFRLNRHVVGICSYNTKIEKTDFASSGSDPVYFFDNKINNNGDGYSVGLLSSKPFSYESNIILRNVKVDGGIITDATEVSGISTTISFGDSAQCQMVFDAGVLTSFDCDDWGEDNKPAR